MRGKYKHIPPPNNPNAADGRKPLVLIKVICRRWLGTLASREPSAFWKEDIIQAGMALGDNFASNR